LPTFSTNRKSISRHGTMHWLVLDAPVADVHRVAERAARRLPLLATRAIEVRLWS
jgi:hypothetical protein